MPISLDNVKTFHIVFHPDTGGNHLANLLSTHEIFLPRFSSENYIEDLYQLYNKKSKTNFVEGKLNMVYNAHPGYVYPIEYILQNRYFLKNRNSKKIYIVTGHHYHYTEAYKNKTLDFVDIKASILVSNITTEGRAYKRFRAIAIVDKKITKQEIYKFYTTYCPVLPYTIGEKIIINEKNGAVLNVDNFFMDEGSYYLQDFMKTNFDIQLPDIIHDLHKLWTITIDRSIELAENK